MAGAGLGWWLGLDWVVAGAGWVVAGAGLGGGWGWIGWLVTPIVHCIEEHLIAIDFLIKRCLFRCCRLP